MAEQPGGAGPTTMMPPAMRPVQVEPGTGKRAVPWVPILVGGVPITAFVVILIVGLVSNTGGGERDLLQILLDGLSAITSWASSLLPFFR